MGTPQPEEGRRKPKKTSRGGEVRAAEDRGMPVAHRSTRLFTASDLSMDQGTCDMESGHLRHLQGSSLRPERVVAGESGRSHMKVLIPCNYLPTYLPQHKLDFAELPRRRRRRRQLGLASLPECSLVGFRATVLTTSRCRLTTWKRHWGRCRASQWHSFNEPSLALQNIIIAITGSRSLLAYS